MSRSADHTGGSVWWLWPATPLLGLTATSLLLAARIDERVYQEAWRTPKSLDESTALLMMAIVVAMVSGTVVAVLMERDPRSRSRSSWPMLEQDAADLLHRLYPWLIGFTVFGYVVWITVGLSRGLNLEDVRTVIASQDNFLLPVKDKLETVPGLTTLSQVAVPATIIGVLLDIGRPSVTIRRAYRLLLALALIRAFMMAERLAIAELVVPITVLRATAFAQRATGRRRLLVTLAPVIGSVLLLGGFAATEYSRSWNWYSSRTESSFADFASERLLGYYATAHNNGALTVTHGETVSDIPYNSTTFFWHIPPGSQLGGGIADDVADDNRRVLKTFGNPEFNSPGGAASILADFGTVGGILFAFMLGVGIGSLHLSFLHGRIPGLLLYPVVYTGLLEFPRYLYWFQGRATPAIVIAFLVTLLLRRSIRTLVPRLDPIGSMRPTGGTGP